MLKVVPYDTINRAMFNATFCCHNLFSHFNLVPIHTIVACIVGKVQHITSVLDELG